LRGIFGHQTTIKPASDLHTGSGAVAIVHNHEPSQEALETKRRSSSVMSYQVKERTYYLFGRNASGKQDITP
jgi:hypothetical protein